MNEQTCEIPVLLLHGWGCDANIYAGFTDTVYERTTLVTLDFPAHGKSEEPPAPWGVEDFAVQVMQLLEDNHIDKVDIIAHSFGGRVAVYLAVRNPQMVGKLVITGGSGIKKPATAQASKRTARYKRLSAAARFLMKAPVLEKPMKNMQEKLIQKYGSKDYAALSEGMRASFVKIVSEDLTPLLKQIAAPVLLIWGENDEETPLWMGQTMEREIPDAGLVVFEGRSHYAFLEESARFLTIVRQFFWGGREG
ncbi:MAG: alpha/beta hydrolase [Clostridiales bacterium]|nr:alpha/beta hydrolase [Clostridiales bacterium]